MIERLSGVLLEKEPGRAQLDVGGVGYGLEMPTSACDQLPEIGEKADLHTLLYVREDAMILFGFMHPEEREAFKIFIQLSGIGPKTALGILSTISIDRFAQAVITGDVKTLTNIPGIGKKSAERIILEMKDRVTRLPKTAADAATPRLSETALQACDALIALGCRPTTAEKAVSQAVGEVGEDVELEALIREALKHR